MGLAATEGAAVPLYPARLGAERAGRHAAHSRALQCRQPRGSHPDCPCPHGELHVPGEGQTITQRGPPPGLDASILDLTVARILRHTGAQR